jgi:hypothetical protein
MKLGAVLGKKDVRNLRLSNYLPSALPEPPPVIDWIGGHENRLGMRHNDEVSNCVEVAFWNALAVDAACTGDSFNDDQAGALLDYVSITGYNADAPLDSDGKNPTDNGTNPEDALRFYSKLPDGDPRKILAWGEVNRFNLREVRQALDIFGSIYTAFALPMSAQRQVGTEWFVDPMTPIDNIPGSWGGHMVLCQRLDFSDPLYLQGTVDTWGSVQKFNLDFWAKYCTAAYFFVTPLWIAQNGETPSNFNLQQLMADVAILKRG